MTGFTVIEMLVALIVGVALVAAGAHMYGKYHDNAANQNAAEHAHMVAKAVRLYVGDHHDDIVARINPQTQTLTLGLDEIQRKGYGKDIAPTNIFGQSYTIGIRKNVNTAKQQANIDTLIVTAGGREAIADGQLLGISQRIGAEGGAMLHAAPGIVQGAFGGWSADPKYYGLTQAQAGGVAVALFVVSHGAAGGRGSHNKDVLHRIEVSGKSDLNEMKAPLVVAKLKDLGPGEDRGYEGNAQTKLCNEQTKRYGQLAQTRDGVLVSCRNGRWQKASEGQWKDSGADFAWLSAIKGGNNVGDVRVAQRGSQPGIPPQAYVWQQAGSAPGQWVPISIDQHGSMQVPNQLVVGNAIKLPPATATCDPAKANLAVNTQGNVVVCKNRQWAEVATK